MITDLKSMADNYRPLSDDELQGLDQATLMQALKDRAALFDFFVPDTMEAEHYADLFSMSASKMARHDIDMAVSLAMDIILLTDHLPKVDTPASSPFRTRASVPTDDVWDVFKGMKEPARALYSAVWGIVLTLDTVRSQDRLEILDTFPYVNDKI